MGEAWFIGEKRRLFTELIDAPFEQIKTTDLSVDILFAISSGTKSFGHREEWDEWFKYLLPDLILRCQDFKWFNEMLVQNVVTAFMSIYWNGINEEYEGFRGDVISSLSHCLMSEDLWFESKVENTQTINLIPVFLDLYKDGKDELRLGWNAAKSDENLSAMLFFCLKYLTPEEIRTWTKSIFLITSEHLRGAFMIWLLGAYDILNEPIVLPSKIVKANPKIDWDDFHLLGSRYGSIDAEHPPDKDFNDNRHFLPSENVKVFLEEIHRQMTDALIIDWAESFAKDNFILESTYNIPELLLSKLSNQSI